MYDPNSIPRRSAARLLLSPLALLYMSSPAAASDAADAAEVAEQEKVQAAKVADKLERAKKTHEDKEDAEAVRHFKHEVAEYMELHNKELARLGTKESTVVQKALAAAITAKRARARQGDIFLPEVQVLFKRLVSAQLKGPDAQAAQKAVVEGNPGHDEDSIPVTVKVNGAYPAGASHSTVPSTVLATLPPLSEPLQYLFVGRSLVILDMIAQIIVDYIPAAAPELIK